MAIEIKKTLINDLNEKEYDAMETAFEVLKELQIALICEQITTLENVNTGEVIHTKELSRVLGILNGFTGNATFDCKHEFDV